MGKNHQPPTETTTDQSTDTATTEPSDLISQQQTDPSNRLEAPVSDNSVNNPIIINR